jgi:predicted HTH transcriptional regulator
MREIDKILNKIEDCILRQYYEPVETEKVELKLTPPNLKSASSVLQSINAFMNTDGGILIIGIRDNNNTDVKSYQLLGYNDDFEANLKLLPKKFTDKTGNELD